MNPYLTNNELKKYDKTKLKAVTVHDPYGRKCTKYLRPKVKK